MSNAVATQQPKTSGVMEFVPFGAMDKIKLSVAIIQNTVAVPTRSGATCSEKDAIKFMMLCQARRLDPFSGDAFLIGYDGQNGPTFSLITAHQAFLKRAESSPDFDGMVSGILVLQEDGSIEEREGDFYLPNEADKIVGGWAKVFHKKRSHPTYRKLRMQRFNKGMAQWKEDAAGMICKCAEADALRSTFPTLLGGLYMQGEQSIEVTSSIPAEANKPNIPSMFTAGGGEKPALPAPEKDAPAETYTPLESLRALIEKAGVKESSVIEVGRGTGVFDDSLGSLDAVFAMSPASIETMVKSWKTTLVAVKKHEGTK